MFPNFVALTHANTLTLSPYCFAPHRKCKSFSLKAIKCAHELHSFTQTKCEWIKMWKNSRLVSAQNKSSCTNAMTFVFQENSVINWPHVHFYTSFSCCSSISIWFSSIRYWRHSHRKSHKSIFHHDEWNRYGRSIAWNVYGNARVILLLYHLFGSSTWLYVERERERKEKTRDNFLRFCLLQMLSIACDSFLLFLLFQIHFFPIFFGNRCLFTQPLKLAIFHISSEFIPEIKRKKKITAGSWEQNSKKAKKREKNTDRKKNSTNNFLIGKFSALNKIWKYSI